MIPQGNTEAYWRDSHRILFNKDCRSMADLPDEHVQMVVTSPPYWGLRKYSGLPDLVWGDKEDCQHEWDETIRKGEIYDTKTGGSGSAVRQAGKVSRVSIPDRVCSLCGAWKGAYGLEPTPEMYVQHTIEILREIRRVLRKDGVVFWNIGDSYYGSGGDHKEGGKNDAGFQGDLRYGVQAKQERHNILKPKDLCLIPFRVAIAAQKDGWWVRSVIIWNKPNPMPESVTDRPTESHEYILMLTKSAKYYWDMEAVREPQQLDSLLRATRGWDGDTKRDYPSGPQSHIDRYFNKTYEEAMSLPGRNLRSVWTFPTRGYPEAHFATFPEALPERCIKAASKEGDIILDPFAGSGTTLKVAAELNRRAIGYELSEEYCKLAVERNRQSCLC